MSRGQLAWRMCLVVGLTSAATWGAPYDVALAQAKQDGKYLVIVVNDDDCPDCKRLDETLQDAEVQDWLNRRKAHQIATFPTVILMSSQPRELGRQEGYLEPKSFIRSLDGLTQSSLVRGEGGFQKWAGHDVVLSTIDRAVSLTAKGEFEKALKELVWCFEHRASRSAVFAVQGLPKILSALASLGEQYPPAGQTLRAFIAAAEQETLRTRRPSTYALYTIKHGHLILKDEAGLVAHYDRMKRAFPKGRGARDLSRIIYGPLLNARRYEDLRYSVSNPNETAMFFEQARRSGTDKDEMRKLMASRYEVLLGLGMDREAASLTESLLSIDGSRRTRTALVEAALRSGRPTDSDISYARKLYRATDGRRVRDAVLLAKLLAAKTPKSTEAIKIVRTSLKMARNEADRRALKTCLQEINTGRGG